MTIKKKSQKPTDANIHLKYLCNECGCPHWLSFKEASTKRFKVVCDCNNVFTVKRVTNFKLVYAQTITKTNVVEKQNIPLDLLDSCIKSLMVYGFTKEESKTLITETYNKNPITDIKLLIKETLASIKE